MTMALKVSEESGEVAKGVVLRETQIKIAMEAMDAIIVNLHVIKLMGQDPELVFDMVMQKNNLRLEEFLRKGQHLG